MASVHVPYATTPQPDTTAGIINTAATQHNIPPWVLWGVFGQESGFGAYGNWFGLVSVPRTGTFHGDANKAAETLAGLYYGSSGHKGYGNWDQALSVYNVGKPTGGYNASKIRSVFNTGRASGVIGAHVGSDATPVQKLAAGPAGDAAATALKALSVPAQILKLLASVEFWLRLGEGVAGLVLIAMGLKTLTGASIPTPIGLAAKAVA